MKYYLVTIKSRGAPYTTREELDHFIRKCMLASPIGEQLSWSSIEGYELPSTGRYHYHTIISASSTWRYLKYIRNMCTKRMYIHLKEFDKSDYNKIVGYIRKDYVDNVNSPYHYIGDNQDDFITRNVWTHEDLFITC